MIRSGNSLSQTIKDQLLNNSSFCKHPQNDGCGNVTVHSSGLVPEIQAEGKVK